MKLSDLRPKALLQYHFAIACGLFAACSTAYAEVDLVEFRNTMLSELNKYRALHVDTPPLTQDSSLNSAAQSWAQNLLQTGSLKYSSGINDGETLFYERKQLPSDPPLTEEQIAMYKSYYPDFEAPTPVTGASIATDASAGWYNEYQHYDYNTAQSTTQDSVGHFTQVVWKETQRVGCGVASKVRSDNTIEAYVVCRYSPRGNTYAAGSKLESYSNNVKPRK